MRWTTEARILRLLDRIPGGSELHYQVQRRLIRSFPLNESRFAREVAYARRHLAAHGSGLAGLSALEFGAGRHLTVALAIALEGSNVTAFDVSPLARVELVRDAAHRLGSRVPPDGDVTSVLRSLGVDYRMMSSNRFPGVEDCSIDLVYSTSVLEHVPGADLPPLMDEVCRVLRPGGVASFVVDYKDHYSYGDRTLPSLHFLTVKEEDWFARYSPSNHFQNRLRHADVVRILEEAGLAVETRDQVGPSDADLAWLAAADLDEPFAGRPYDDLAVDEAHIVARLKAEA